MWRRVKEQTDTRLLLIIFAVGLLLCIWGATCWQLGRDRLQFTSSAERETQDLVRVFSEHGSRTISAADQTVIFLRHRYQALGDRLEISRELRSGLGPSDLYTLFGIVNAEGQIVLSTHPFSRIDVSDRPYFKIHQRDPSDKLHISIPLINRASHRWSILLTRRISNPDGSFGGVVMVSLDPLYFTHLYNEIDVGNQGSIALVGEDGVMRARRVGHDNTLGQDITASEVFTAMKTAGKAGNGIFPGPIDGRKRFYAFAHLPNLPLYVLVGLDYEEQFAHYRTHRLYALVFASAITLVVIAFTTALLSQMKQLIISRENAQAASNAKSRFLSNMSHELRTPLNGVIGYAELLKMENEHPRQAKFINAIHTSGLRLLKLVEAVLELSRLESGREAISVAPVSIRGLLEDTLAKHRQAAAIKNITLEGHIGQGTPNNFLTDTTKISRILDILLTNAIEATVTGHVQVLIRVKASRINFKVTDTGTGVPLSVKQRLFEQFTIADDSSTRAREGAGLGLAIAAQLTKLLDGSITLDESNETGSIFSVSLPFRSSTQQSGDRSKP